MRLVRLRKQFGRSVMVLSLADQPVSHSKWLTGGGTVCHFGGSNGVIVSASQTGFVSCRYITAFGAKRETSAKRSMAGRLHSNGILHLQSRPIEGQ